MNKLTKPLTAAVVFGLFAAATASAHAALLTPPFRGDANTEYSYWDIFADGYTAPDDIGNVDQGTVAEGGTGDGILYQTGTSTGFLTLTGNIYSFSEAIGFELHDEPGFVPGMVLLQIRTIAGEMDFSSFALNIGGNALSPDAGVELFRETVPTSRGPSEHIELAFEWDLTDDAALFTTDNKYSLSFNAVASSTSLDYVSLDTAPGYQTLVPEPSAAMLLVGALLVFTCLRRRSR